MSVVQDLYPPSVTGVPRELTQPGPKYRQQVWILLASLLLFFAFYLALVAGTGYLAYLAVVFPLAEVNRATVFAKLASVAITAMLFLFTVKNVFKRQKVDREGFVEIKEAEYPELFGFIRRVCEETAAPFPHQVFVSPDVNAAVIYNSSVLNLVFPVRKNLLIGLGLVNTLNLSEFKAVMAHEFGHFGQNNVKADTYVYIAQRVIHDMVYGRDFFDELLRKWQNIGDWRLSLPAYAVGGLVWVVRQIMSGAFRLIAFLDAALSRQMEFHADLVAVSVTGSDALIHGLRRLDYAGACFAQTMEDLRAAADQKLYTRDLFYHQTQAGPYVRRVAKKPDWGTPPELPPDPQVKIQVFEPGEDGIPSMYASHPSNYDREQNAKQHYFRSPIDERSPWILFRNAEQLRERVTRKFYEPAADLPPDTPLRDAVTVQAFIDDEHAETTYDERYHGLFDDRYVEPGDLKLLTDAVVQHPWPAARIAASLQRLYGGQLKEWVEAHHTRRGEHHLLSGLDEGELKLRGKTFTFREQEVRASEVKGLLQTVDAELEKDHTFLKDLDADIFQVHYQAACHLTDGSHEELWRRYHFHLGVQEILKASSAEMGRLEAVFHYMQENGKQLSEADFNEVTRIFREARAALGASILRAQSLVVPPLKNMPAGQPLHPFLLEGLLVAELPEGATSFSGEWVGSLAQQMHGVREKSKRIHFKSLGAILALQERIAGQWRQRMAAGSPPGPITAGEAPQRA